MNLARSKVTVVGVYGTSVNVEVHLIWVVRFGRFVGIDFVIFLNPVWYQPYSAYPSSWGLLTAPASWLHSPLSTFNSDS